MLGVVDIVLLSCSLLFTLAIGVYHGIKGAKATPTEYMLGGRAMSPFPLAMSMMVGTISPITIMGNIGEIYTYGTQIWMMDLGLVIGMVVVAQFFIPIFYPLNMVSLYQYVEKRFQSSVLRLFSVVITVSAAYLFIGFLLYPPSVFLFAFTKLPILTNIVIMGLVCGVYSAFGGVKAVVYTDMVQSIIMLIGVVSITVQVAVNLGGISNVWSIASERNRIEFFNMNMNPYQRHSFWLTITYGFFFSLSTFGVNQSQTQRTFSTGSVKQAQRVIYYAIVGTLLLRIFINLAGVAIFANYADCDPLTKNEGYTLPNVHITAIYVIDMLIKIPGLAGLFVASVYAAALSSVSTQVNSMAALLWEDFLKERNYFKLWSETKITRLQKVLVFCSALVGIAMSFIATIRSAFLSMVLRLSGAISGPMIGLFLIGLYLPWIKYQGAAAGLLVSIIVGLWVVTGQLLTQEDPPNLPLSRDGCSLNATFFDDSYLEADNSTSISNTTIQSFTEPSEDGGGFYAISYCLNYCWGTLACVVVAALTTLITGSNTPDTVEECLIAPIAWRFFTRNRKREEPQTTEEMLMNTTT